MPEAATEYRIHVTSQSGFKSCRLRWYFGDKEQLAWEPRRPQQALMIGTAVHLGLELFYHGPWEKKLKAHVAKVKKGLPRDTLPEDKAKVQEGMDLARGMVEFYTDWAKDHDEEDSWEVLASEVQFDLPLRIPKMRFSEAMGRPVRVFLAGKIDQLGRLDGDLFVGEIKTTMLGGEDETHRLLLEEQPGIYQWAVQFMIDNYDDYKDILEPIGIQPGEKVQGVYYTFLRKKLPTVPKELVNGGFSVAKTNIDTTVKVWDDTLRAAGCDPTNAKYGPVRKIIAERKKGFVHRELVHRSKREIDLLMTRVFHTTLDMIREETVFYPSPDAMKCRICSFQGPCIAFNKGADWEAVLKGNYVKRK